jgi:hypothetical protein
MKRGTRILLAIVALLILAAVVLGVDWTRRRSPETPVGTATPLPAGSIPIYFNGELVGGFTPADQEKLGKVSFIEAVEGKLQEGWLLRDVLLMHLPADPDQLSPDTVITVVSTSRGKSAVLNWAEVQDRANMVMFDLSNRGTLKLVSLLPKLDTRDEWVQDVDRIEVSSP